MAILQFRKPILVYIPCYNCEKGVVEVLSDIPLELRDRIECLIVDNQSRDRTVEFALEEIKGGKYPFGISLIRPKKNIGYAGSQKLAYSLVLNSPEVKYVVMMHGDGQYPPSLLNKFIFESEKGYALVNAYRDRNIYGRKEETPPLTYFIIRSISNVENLLTGFRYKEWQNGFVMYSSEFLRKIPLHRLSQDLQIDGEFLICAGILGEKIHTVPIYKKYKEYKAFCGMARTKYIMDIARTMTRYGKRYYHNILKDKSGSRIDFDFDVIA